jgi:hypothetical protein
MFSRPRGRCPAGGRPGGRPGAVLGLAFAHAIGLSVGHAPHVGAPCRDAEAFFVALTCAMLAGELAKRLVLARDEA